MLCEVGRVGEIPVKLIYVPNGTACTLIVTRG